MVHETVMLMSHAKAIAFLSESGR